MPTSHRAANLLSIFALATACGGLFAADLPTAGSQIQQITPPPAPPRPEVVLPPEKPPAAVVRSAEERRIRVRQLEISGASVFGVDELLAVAQFKPDTQLTLKELREIGARISEHYRSKGYFLAQAFLPPQDVSEGNVQLTVVEGRIGQVQLRNQSALSDSVGSAMLSGLAPDSVINARALERSVLMLSDLPGVAVRSTLAPGKAAGTSDVLVDVSPAARMTGSVELDNQGNRYTGTNRLSLAAGAHELIGWGDTASVRILKSSGSMDYGNLGYQWQVGPVRAALGYTAMRYQLGEEFASALAGGVAQIGNLSASYPLVRSRTRNLSVQFALDDKRFTDRAEAVTPASITEKRSRVRSLGLSGDFQDTYLAGGVTNFGLTLSGGTLDLLGADARATDAQTAQTQGDFGKLSLSLGRQQSVTSGSTLVASLNAQRASTNLDASEKFSLGGPQGVRAYPAGEANGDEGFLLSLEARTQLDALSERLSGRTQFLIFWDTGVVSANKRPWTGVGLSADRRLSGAGVGLNWTGSGSGGPVIRVVYAHKIGDEAATSAPDASSRLWLHSVYYF